jgi:hypothetical protein
MAGKKRGYPTGVPRGPMSLDHREKIKNSRVLTDLLDIASGKIQASPTRLAAIKIALDKVYGNAPIQIEQQVEGVVNFIVDTGVPRSPIIDAQVLDTVKAIDTAADSIEVDNLLNELKEEDE